MSDRHIPMVAEVQPVAKPKPEESYGTAVIRKTKKEHTALTAFLCLTCVLLATLLAVSGLMHQPLGRFFGSHSVPEQPPVDEDALERELQPNAGAMTGDTRTPQNCGLGFEVEEIPQSYCVYYSFPGTVWITQVGTGTCADGVLSAYDVIMSVDGVGITTKGEFETVLSEHETGDILELRIFRGGCYYRIKLPLTGN